MTLSPRPTASKQNVQNIVMAIDEFSVDNTEYMFAYLPGKKNFPMIQKINSVWWNSHVLSWVELIWTNGKRDSGTKFSSPEVCIPFAPTVKQGDARYARSSIYSLSYRSIVWSLLCYCVRARDHCCVLCDVTRDLLFTWYTCTCREPTGLSSQMVKN